MNAESGNRSEIAELAAELLRTVGIRDEVQVTPLAGGRNNRVFQVTGSNRKAVLKWYFSHEQDQQDRLDTEFRFCQFCWTHGIRQVPKPLAADEQRRLGLYEQVEGRSFSPGDSLRDEDINAACRFLVDLNRSRDAEAAEWLPNAAEACYCIEEHLQCVSRRVERLFNLQTRDEVDQAASEFVQQKLLPRWVEIHKSISEGNQGLAERLAAGDRCISPSDFGFHNALRAASPGGEEQQVRFVDFEYAGWDDPAKLVCDFFCQVEIPVPRDYWQFVVNEVGQLVGSSSEFASRCGLLLPAYQIKWACIVLNEFLPEHRARRQFSAAQALSTEELKNQLAKAKALVLRTES